eukprot:768536-Hanusia_phi.AAC.19
MSTSFLARSNSSTRCICCRLMLAGEERSAGCTTPPNMPKLCGLMLLKEASSCSRSSLAGAARPWAPVSSTSAPHSVQIPREALQQAEGNSRGQAP